MTLIWYVAMNVIIDNATVLYYCMYTVHTNSRHIVVATYNVGRWIIYQRINDANSCDVNRPVGGTQNN